mgnify:CR=1 FL=1
MLLHHSSRSPQAQKRAYFKARARASCGKHVLKGWTVKRRGQTTKDNCCVVRVGIAKTLPGSRAASAGARGAEGRQARQFPHTDALQCRYDFKSAAAVYKELQEFEDFCCWQFVQKTEALRRRQEELETEIRACADKQDYTTAVALTEELKALKTQEGVQRLSLIHI